MQINRLKYFFILFVLTSNCSSERQGINNLTLISQSSHYNYYSNKDDLFILDTIWMEKHYDWVTSQLEIIPNQKLNYHKYLNKQHLFEITGKNTSGFAEIGTWNFHTIWHPEGHENVHTLVINNIGHPPALFNEGIAVALAPQPIYGFGIFIGAPTWNGQSIDEISRELKQNNEIPNISSLLESNDFFNYSTNITYPLAGSFCKYLIENYSINQLKSFYQILSFESSSNDVINHFNNIYSKDIVVAWNDWIEQL